MIHVLIDAAMRSLFVGLIVAVGLRAFRIRNVFAQKAALGLVLVGALTMPLLMPIADRLQLLPANASIVLPAHPMTLLEELQARLQTKSGSGTLPTPIVPPTRAPNSPQPEKRFRASAGFGVGSTRQTARTIQPPRRLFEERGRHRQCPESRRNAAVASAQPCGVLAGIARSFDLSRGSRSVSSETRSWTGCYASFVAHRRTDFHPRSI